MSVSASAGSALPASGLPVVNQALEPAWVRDGSASTKKSYQTALAFEQMLVEQLSQSLTASSGLGGEDGEEGESSGAGSSGASAATGPLSSMLPQALTSGVMEAGGLGLAAQMTRQLQMAAGATAVGARGSANVAAATGGTNASAGTPAPVTGDANTSARTTAPATSDVTATGGTSA
jgi:Rod binding domain-containing protein